MNSSFIDRHGDGVVSTLDLERMLRDFESGSPPVDVNGDGFVSGDDFDILMEQLDTNRTGPVTYDDGWTVFPVSPDAPVIDVPASSARDIQQFVNSMPRIGSSVLRLQRGGHYPNFEVTAGGGDSPGAFKVITCYGDVSLPRPRVSSNADSAAIDHFKRIQPVQNMAYLNLDIACVNRLRDRDGSGLAFLMDGENVHFQGLRIEGFSDGFNVQGNVQGLTIRRCSVSKCFGPATYRGQGIYCDGPHGVLVVDTTFDDNGYLEGYSSEDARIRSHNTYFTANCERVRFENVLSSRAASFGLKADNEMHILNCFVYQCANGAHIRPDDSSIRNTTICNSVREGIALWVNDAWPKFKVGSVIIADNRFLDRSSNSREAAIRSRLMADSVRSIVSFERNTFRNWYDDNGSFVTHDPSSGVEDDITYDDNTFFTGESRDQLEGYSTSLGMTVEQFLDRATRNEYSNWDSRFTAEAVNTFLDGQPL